ncbi:Origin recognition complex subunit 3 [Bulinus truncatus]|nr:Origin recognition complex subunit 3 [Bulinus truncatus]
MSVSNAATSVSTGCFAFKGKCKKANELTYLSVDKDKYVKNRLRLYEKQWDQLSKQIETLRSDLNSQIFEDLVTFILSCHKDRNNLHKLPVTEIPTAVLLTGVNTPDHSIMFTSLKNILKTKVTPLIARIFPKDCLRISTLISSVFHQLSNTSLGTDDIDQDESLTQDDELDLECTTFVLKKAVKRNRLISMSALSKWYQIQYSSTIVERSPRKKAKTLASPRKKVAELENGIDKTVSKPHIVIMLEEVENINAGILQDFISLCSSYLTSLPIVLVMGIATAVTAIHQILPSSASSLMCMEKFHAPPASQYLTHLLDKLIMTADIPFKLGPKVFNFLLDNFLYNDFSIVNFIMGFKLCLIEHFLSNPLSVLCCPIEDIDSVLKLTHAELEVLRRHGSFMRYVEGITGPLQAKLLTDDTATKTKLLEEYRNIHSFHVQFFQVLRFLHCLGQNLPKYPLGKNLRELYSTCLYENLSESEGYKQTFFLLRLMCCDELDELLGSCLKTIQVHKTEESLERLNNDVNKFRYRLKHLDEELEEENTSGDPGKELKVLPQRAKLYELKEKLQSLSSVRKRSPYERLREEILSYLDSFFKRCLICPLSLPLHEMFYFNDLGAIKDHIRPAPRHSIQLALSEPGKLLSCPCCRCNSESILSTMPDLCIVYKLHLECGTLVNLYDWLQAFVTIITSKDAKETPSVTQKTKGPTVEQRARFIRAVSELQFLGFIKGTQRKTDHVTRLTW